MSFAAPVSKDGFHYNGDLWVEVGGGLHRHKRASTAELINLLRPDKKSKTANKSPANGDNVGHWWEAQLKHYGLLPSKTKAVAKVRLLDALNAKSLHIPKNILKIEDNLRKEFNTAERKAKAQHKAQLNETVPKTSANKKRKHAGNVGNEVVQPKTKRPRQAPEMPIENTNAINIPNMNGVHQKQLSIRDSSHQIESSSATMEFSQHFPTQKVPSRMTKNIEKPSVKRNMLTIIEDGFGVRTSAAKFLERIKNDPVLKEDPVVKRNPVVKKDLVVKKNPVVKKDPVVKKESTLKKEPPVKNEATVKKEPVIKDSVVKQESIGRKTPVVKAEKVLKKQPNMKKDPSIKAETSFKQELLTMEEPFVKKDPMFRADKSFKKEMPVKKEHATKKEAVSRDSTSVNEESILKPEPMVKMESPSKSSPQRFISLGLINGTYDVYCPDIAAESGSTLMLCLEGDRLWGCFDFGAYQGVMLFPQRPYRASDEPILCQWRGIEAQTGNFAGGDDCTGYVEFCGDGSIRGTLGLFQSCDFVGVHRPGPSSRSIASFRDEWNEYGQAMC